MGKLRQKTFNTVSAAADVLIVVVSMALAFWMRFSVLEGPGPLGSLVYHVSWAALFSPVFVFFYGLFGIYDQHTTYDTMRTTGRVIAANTLAAMLFIDCVFVFRLVDFSRWLIVMFWLFTTVFSCAKVFLANRWLRAKHRRGLGQRRIVVVGSGPIAASFAKGVSQETLGSLALVGNVGPQPLAACPAYLGPYGGITTILDEVKPDEVVVALESEENDLLDTVLINCENSGIKISVVQTYQHLVSGKSRIGIEGGVALINISRVALDNMGIAFVKRAIDLLGSFVLIVATSPIMLAAAVGTKLSSPGPVIFKQVRVGRGRQQFDMYKFRSMRVNDLQDSAWTTSGDPRRTAFGAFMRRYSIDELPQLFNVLKGDMSLVGPRPEIPRHVERFKGDVSLYMVRHQVRPGMTGWAQVNGLRGDTSIEERVRYDLFYIQNWSLLFDLRILAMTPFKGIVNKQEPLAGDGR